MPRTLPTRGRAAARTLALVLLACPALPLTAAAQPTPPVSFFNVRSGDGENTLFWVNPTTGYFSTRILYRTDTFPTDPNDPAAMLLGDFVGTAGAVASAIHPGLTNGTTYFYAAFVDDGSQNFSAARTSLGRPDDTTGPVRWSYTAGGARAMTVGVSPNASYHAASGDRVLHALTPGPGLTGGHWPAGWMPVRMPAAVRNRPGVVQFNSTTVKGANRIVLASAEDGRVYCFDAETGALLWTSPVLGAAVRASVSGVLKDFGGAEDVLLVGVRGGGRRGRFYGLDLFTGAILWSFDGAGRPMGNVETQATVDIPNSRVYFTSRRRRGADTVWCLEFTSASATLLWSANVGDTAGAPALRGGVVYVPDRRGQVHALDAQTGAPRWASPYQTLDGRVRGFVFAERLSNRLYFATRNQVHAIQDDGPSASAFWTAPVAVPRPSQPAAVGGRVYTGGSDGRFYSFNAASPDPGAPSSVALGDPLVPKRVGDPTFDVRTGVVVVSTDEGVIYGVAFPF